MEEVLLLLPLCRRALPAALFRLLPHASNELRAASTSMLDWSR